MPDVNPVASNATLAVIVAVTSIRLPRQHDGDQCEVPHVFTAAGEDPLSDTETDFTKVISHT
jgi:hypothetical protein